MTDFERYAVYWAPEAGSPLADFGAAWLGWEADLAANAPRLGVAGLPAPIEDLTASARRYGFHATLKPPFRLAAGADRAGLERALAALATATPAVEAPALELRADLGFAALRPSAPCPALDALAARCVTEVDAFRAPPAEAELNRRRAAKLSEVQEAHLARWGYPYVLDQFQFHVTLAGRLSPGDFAMLEAALAPHLSRAIGAPWTVREICLFGDPGAGRTFHLLRRFPLRG
jgi:putative phosphonate metabolism protein